MGENRPASGQEPTMQNTVISENSMSFREEQQKFFYKESRIIFDARRQWLNLGNFLRFRILFLKGNYQLDVLADVLICSI